MAITRRPLTEDETRAVFEKLANYVVCLLLYLYMYMFYIEALDMDIG